jgi:hypothetical protein
MGGGGGGGGAVNIEMLGRPVIDDVRRGGRSQTMMMTTGVCHAVPRLDFVTKHGAGPSRLPSERPVLLDFTLQTAAEIHTRLHWISLLPTPPDSLLIITTCRLDAPPKKQPTHTTATQTNPHNTQRPGTSLQAKC